MGFLPADLEVPEVPEAERFRLRAITVHDVDPPEKAGYDAEVWLWVRAGELGTGLDAELYATVRRRAEERWPLRRVA